MRDVPAGWLLAGRIGRPHGLDGSFHVSAPDARLLGHGATVVVDGVQRTIERRAGTDDRPLVRLRGCSSREAALELRGRQMLVALADAPALAEGEYWAQELEGLRVVDGASEVGVVRRLVVLPSCEALEVARSGGPSVLVPMVHDAIRSIDVAGGVVDVAMSFVEGSRG